MCRGLHGSFGHSVGEARSRLESRNAITAKTRVERGAFRPFLRPEALAVASTALAYRAGVHRYVEEQPDEDPEDAPGCRSISDDEADHVEGCGSRQQNQPEQREDPSGVEGPIDPVGEEPQRGHAESRADSDESPYRNE